MDKKIVLASSNRGKLAEFQQLFVEQPYTFIPQSEFSVSDAEETGLTFVENALIKARHAAKKTGLPCIADDSGIVIDALDGRPGIYSARYAGEHGNAQANIQKVLTELENETNRHAYFYCVITYLKHAEDPTPIICEGIWHGEILEKPKGEKGFGYDPIFYVPTHHCSAAELASDKKNAISHRGQALQKFIKEVLKN